MPIFLSHCRRIFTLKLPLFFVCYEEGKSMGKFKEEITLENILDRGFAEHGYIKESEIRTLKGEAMPDTGAWTLVINEEVREKLGLVIKETSESTLADGKANIYDVTEYTNEGSIFYGRIRWRAICRDY
jgi:hypothetical protein